MAQQSAKTILPRHQTLPKSSQPPPAVKTDAPEQGKKEALPLKEPVAEAAAEAAAGRGAKN